MDDQNSASALSPTDPASGIQMTSEQKPAHSEPRTARDLAEHLLARFPEPTPEQRAADERREEQRRSHLEWAIRARWMDEFMNCVGPRYMNATLDSFAITQDSQRRVLAALRRYIEHFATEVKAGNGIILFGPSGVGKDHLLIGMARALIHHATIATQDMDRERTLPCPVAWQSCVSLYSTMRDRIGADESEARIIATLAGPKVLIISDAIPPNATLTDYQRAVLFDIIDHRYRWCRPTWASLNVASGKEADDRLGPAITDRLRDGALALWCGWPSHRKARTLAEAQGEQKV